MHAPARQLVIAICLLLACAASAAFAGDSKTADELMRSGAAAFEAGNFGFAERDWRQADKLYEAAGDIDGQLDAWLNLGAVQQQTGKFTLAKSTLNAARDVAERLKRDDKLIGIKNALGVAYTFTRDPQNAEQSLTEALALAEKQQSEPATLASIRNNLGNLYAAWSEVLKDRGEPDLYDKAFENYSTAADLAQKGSDGALEAKSLTNAALSAARGGQPAKANELAARSTKAVNDLPNSLEKANLLIAIGQTEQLLLSAKDQPVDAGRLQRDAFNAYESAKDIAKQLNNPLTASYALGYQGRLYETAKRYDEALTLTRRAVLNAQQAQSPDSLYLWQWQTGRIFKAQGKTEDAVASYTSARDTLEAVRSDLALGYGNRGMNATFRAEVGPLYYELADLLLMRADVGGDEVKVQQSLSDARNTVERLRVGELESYFEDPCVNQAQARQTDLTKDLNKIKRGNPAVIYLIPLADRVEILVTTRAGMTRVKSVGVSGDQLTAEVREFRKRLERRTTHRYLANAKQLYTWLIKPIEPMLDEQKIDTLVFVPDGALRTVPMAALHDGNDFLIAKYAVAVSPGLSLRLTDEAEFRPEQRSRTARVLASGLSEQGEDKTFAALPNVEEELATIQQLYGATKLLNDQFRVPNFSRELMRPAEDEYSIVHIASHGVFAADIADTYVLAYDGKLNLTSLETLLRPYQLQGKPIDLLTLSACQTSAGDDQAALERASLGLGGLAVKAGARSALASLWFANDQATGELIKTFYEQLRDHPDAGKARALQQAQLKLIRGEDFSHPVYWAPFLMIGDWL